MPTTPLIVDVDTGIDDSLALLYLLVVFASATTVGLVPAILASVLAFLAFNFFFVPPRWTFRIDQSEHFIALITMLVLALVIFFAFGSFSQNTKNNRIWSLGNFKLLLKKE